MHPDDELRTLRRRRDDLATAQREGNDVAAYPPTLLARTTADAAYPTVPSAFYAVLVAQQVQTPEGEGMPTAFESGGGFLALNLGTAVPPQGAYVLCTLCGSRWVFRYDG